MQEAEKNKLILRNQNFPSTKRRKTEDKSEWGRQKGSRRKKGGREKRGSFD